MSSPITIRPAKPEDADAILHSHVASIQGLCAHDYTAEEIAAWTSPKRADAYRGALEKGHAIFVALEDDRIVGFGDLGGEEIFGLYVHPQYVGRGVGKLLLEALESEARARGIHALKLNSTITAKPFYSNRGYHPISETMHTVSPTIKLRCVEMQKEL